MGATSIAGNRMCVRASSERELHAHMERVRREHEGDTDSQSSTEENERAWGSGPGAAPKAAPVPARATAPNLHTVHAGDNWQQQRAYERNEFAAAMSRPPPTFANAAAPSQSRDLPFSVGSSPDA